MTDTYSLVLHGAVYVKCTTENSLKMFKLIMPTKCYVYSIQTQRLQRITPAHMQTLAIQIFR